MGVAGEEAAEDEAIEALRLAVGGEARVQVDGVGFDQEGEGGGVEFCAVRATGERKKEETGKTGEKERKKITQRRRVPRVAQRQKR